MKGNIPPETTSFVGRDMELAWLDRALAQRRLITLTGPGGVGKTRLAQRAALRTALGTGGGPAPLGDGSPDGSSDAAPGRTPGVPPGGAALGTPSGTAPGSPSADPAYGAPARFPDGVWWADLATINSPLLLLPTVSDAVDLADHSPRMAVEALCEWLADKRLLLVLDSCEHVADDCAQLVGELLTAASGLTVLTTSRRALGNTREAVREVAPLPAEGADALALFRERVSARLGAAPLTAPGAQAGAASICRRMEGIPLAIELAAAQVGAASVAEVAEGLGSRFGLPEQQGYVWPPRHRTLRTAIGWSHELCAPLERLLWARLSVFRGPFDVSAAEAVAAGGPLTLAEVATTLERLVEQSVVCQVNTGLGDRYRMLDTIREYGQEWLRELGESGAVAHRHAEHFSELARWADASWSGSDQLLAYRLIEDTHPDLRAALDHWLDHDPAAAAELAGLLVYFWTCCGHLKEARAALEQALERYTVPGPTRIRALTGLGATVTLQGDHAAAAAIDAQVREAVEADGTGDVRIAAACLTGLLGMLTGRPKEALAAVRAAVAGAPGDPFDSPDRLRCALVEVLSLTALGAFEEGRTLALELRAKCLRNGELWARSYLDYQLSVVALFSSAPAEAIRYARTMLESKRLLGDAFGIALGLDLLAAALAADGRAEEAASVYGTGGAYWRSVGHPQRGAPELQPIREQCERTARAALGDDAYAAALARGAAAHAPAGLAVAHLPDLPGPT